MGTLLTAFFSFCNWTLYKFDTTKVCAVLSLNVHSCQDTAQSRRWPSVDGGRGSSKGTWCLKTVEHSSCWADKKWCGSSGCVHVAYDTFSDAHLRVNLEVADILCEKERQSSVTLFWYVHEI